MLRRIAEKILSDEIKRLKEDKESYEKRNIELRGQMAELENKLSDKQAEIDGINSEKSLVEKRTQELEKENKILRQYYDLDKEPSDEIKTKIHIDLEINRLKEENLKLIAMYNKPAVNTDELVHTARSSSACFPVFQCTLSGHQCMYMD